MRHLRCLTPAAILGCVLLAGCGAQPPPPAGPQAADAGADPTAADAMDAADPGIDPPGTDAVQLTDDTSPVADGATATAREVAGSFGNAAGQLELGDDGRYRWTTGEATEDGTWTLAANGRDLLLDPDAKDTPDRAFTLASPDEIRGDGEPLRRSLD